MASLASVTAPSAAKLGYYATPSKAPVQAAATTPDTLPPGMSTSDAQTLLAQQAAGGGNPYIPTPQGPAAPAPAAAPALTDYAAQYEQSLGAQRSTIAHQIASAMAAMNAQEAGARQAVGLLPGQLSQVYNTGNASLAQQTGALDAAQHASGLQSYMGAAAQMAPVHGAIAADLAARQADVPLLNIGLAQAAAAQHAALQQASLGAYDSVNQQQAQFIASQMAAQQAAQQHAADQAFSAKEQQTGADLSLRNTLAAQRSTPDASTSQALHDQQSALDKAGITDLTAPQAQAARAAPLYTYAMGLVHGGKSLSDIFNQQELSNPNVAKIVEVLNYDLGGKKEVQPRGAAPNGSYFGFDVGPR